MMYSSINDAYNNHSFINAQGDISKSTPYWDFDEDNQQQWLVLFLA